LDQTIWSLASLRLKRISGSKNFHSPARKDFCNKIDPERTFEPVTNLDCVAAHFVRCPGSNGYALAFIRRIVPRGVWNDANSS